MKKDFKKWHDKKSLVDEIEVRPFFHEREIWYCTMGANVGFEQDGNGEGFLRPAIIFRKFNSEIFWAIPLTRTQKETKYYFQFIFQDDTPSVAILSQMKLMDARRLDHKIGDISKDDFGKLTKKFKDILP